MNATCPKCRQVIPVENIALEAGQAKCGRCNEVFRLSEVIHGYSAEPPPEPVPERPFDARATVERSADRLVVQIPFPGFKAGHLGWLALALFVVACSAILIADARDRWLHREIGWGEVPGECFVMLMLLFFFWAFLVRFFSTWGSDTIFMDASWMVTESRAPLRRRRREMIDRSRVQGARKGWIVCEGGTVWLPCRSEAEADWLSGQINAFLQTVPYKAPLDGQWPEEFQRRRRDHHLTRDRQDDRFHS
jgi:predicted Zn finger-like uncharacterized protein